MGGGTIRTFYEHEGRGRQRVPGLSVSPGDQGEDLLGEGDHDAAGDGEDAVGTLGGVMGLEGQAHLQDTVPQQDEAYRPDEGKDKVGQAVDHRQGIVGGQGRDGHHGCRGQDAYQGAIGPLDAALTLLAVIEILIHQHSPSLYRIGRWPGAETGPAPGGAAAVYCGGGRAVRRRPPYGGWPGAG